MNIRLLHRKSRRFGPRSVYYTSRQQTNFALSEEDLSNLLCQNSNEKQVQQESATTDIQHLRQSGFLANDNEEQNEVLLTGGLDMNTQDARKKMNGLYAMAENLGSSMEYIHEVRSYVKEKANEYQSIVKQGCLCLFALFCTLP